MMLLSVIEFCALEPPFPIWIEHRNGKIVEVTFEYISRMNLPLRAEPSEVAMFSDKQGRCIADYNITWRGWIVKPTKKERSRAKWYVQSK